MEKTLTLKVSESDSDERLDIFIAEKIKNLSRTAAKTLIENELVTIDGLPPKASRKVRANETVVVRLPEPPKPETTPQDIALDVLYEDDDVIVVNKPRGLTVHPGAGRTDGTLVNALLHRCGRLSNIGAPLRPGIVHRLDKDTSGVIIAAKNDDSHLSLASQFKAHSTSRRYHTLVWGRLAKDSGTIDIPIGRDRKDRKKISSRTGKAREAITAYRVIKRYHHFTLLEITPKTGRTHQIRTHLSSIKHPVVGDPVYCSRQVPEKLPQELKTALKEQKGQLLHALSLGFTHPSTGKRMEFSSPYPDDMEKLLKLIERCY